ncbi:unnamed protein product [Lota lota]
MEEFEECRANGRSGGFSFNGFTAEVLGCEGGKLFGPAGAVPSTSGALSVGPCWDRPASLVDKAKLRRENPAVSLAWGRLRSST